MKFSSFFASFLLVSGLNYAEIFRNYHLRKKERSKIHEIENIRDLEAKELRRLIGICLVEGIRSFECLNLMAGSVRFYDAENHKLKRFSFLSHTIFSNNKKI